MSDSISLKGTVDRIVFQNEENGWAVVRLLAEKKLITAVGHLLGVKVGEMIKVSGMWVTDPKFGKQIRVESYVPDQPVTVEGIQKYLGSGLVDGIGPVMAERLVEKFGEKTLDIIEKEPKRLSEVEGIGAKRQKMIADAWSSMRNIREVMLFLQSHNISTAHASRIYRDYGEKAVSVVRANPYQLAIDIRGIGFATADKIAQSLGFTQDSPHRIEAGLLHVLRESSQEGDAYSPKPELFQRVLDLLNVEEKLLQVALEQLSLSTEVIVEEDRVYLQALHESEFETAKDTVRILNKELVRPDVDVTEALEWVQKDALIKLAEQQERAVRAAIGAKLLIVTGGPGTGKTTIVNSIIRVLAREKRTISLCAPTGRASKRLQEATGEEAKTIHRLLEYNPQDNAFNRDRDNPLDCDVLIVDEFSMVDLALCRHLFASVSDDTQVILVGDIDQLPSVGPGDVLKSLINAFPAQVVCLDQIFRQSEESLIVSNAHKINEGILPGSSKTPEGDFFFIEKNAPEDALETIVELVASRIPKRFNLTPKKDIQVLTPMHRGILGASNLNATLQAKLNPGGDGMKRGDRMMRVGDKVMQLKNNYDRNVFNGDLGHIHSIDNEDSLVHVQFDQDLVAYPFSELDELSLSYACTIHKSQGSEFPAVVIPLHGQHYVMLRRKLIYTAVTRGKQLVCIVGTKQALRMAVENRGIKPRYTQLTERIGHLLS